MLHALIRTDKDAFHFFGEADAYSLETVREHLPQCVDGRVRLRFEIDRADQVVFERCTRKWLGHLASLGTVVEVKIQSTPGARCQSPSHGRNKRQSSEEGDHCRIDHRQL